ncbi:MAG: UDP-4-amino-4,6-dideoxy-N-acetyl-beta-L-altrosamine transaminase [Planctomycetota bacterium]
MAGAPFLPYGRQDVDDADVLAVAEALRSDWLTTGPRVDEFERALAAACGAPHVVVVNSGTAALHAAYEAAGLGPGDEVLTSPLTFAATANAALHLGAKVRFVDVDARSGLIDPGQVSAALTPSTKLVVPIDYTGQPADYPALMRLAAGTGTFVIADGAHSLGATLDGAPAGTLAHATTFSFHPVKPVTTGEGGAIATANAEWDHRMRSFRCHGMERDPLRQRDPGDPWHYEIQALGLNYRLPDVLCALGTSQLRRLPQFIARRRAIAARYLTALADVAQLELPHVRPGVESGWHLFVVKVHEAGRRRAFFDALRQAGLGVQVHYEPVHLQPYYRDLGHRPGECPLAEDFAARCVSLPLYPALSDSEVEHVIDTVRRVAEAVL